MPVSSTSVAVDSFSDSKGTVYYRIRATGTARAFGPPENRHGRSHEQYDPRRQFAAKDRLQIRSFQATYGDGDGHTPNPSTTVPNPQVTRRIELIAVPQMASFTGALKVSSAFSGPGSAGVVDSYDSNSRSTLADLQSR